MFVLITFLRILLLQGLFLLFLFFRCLHLGLDLASGQHIGGLLLGDVLLEGGGVGGSNLLNLLLALLLLFFLLLQFITFLNQTFKLFQIFVPLSFLLTLCVYHLYQVAVGYGGIIQLTLLILHHLYGVCEEGGGMVYGAGCG